jgi:hypothetical protein
MHSIRSAVPVEVTSHQVGDSVQERQIRAPQLAGASIECEVPVNHTVVELTLVGRLHDDMGFQAGPFRWPQALVFPDCANRSSLMFPVTSAALLPYGSPCRI